jgi:hypoxanthine phosphoribosyltransferase
MTEVLRISDEEQKKLLAHILRQISKEGERFDIVVGVSRGGLVPATLLSQYLDIPLTPVRWSLRDHPDVREETLLDVKQALAAGKRVLVVDDICDEGDTLQQIWEALKWPTIDLEANARAAVLVHNLGGDKFEPDFVGIEINKADKDVWVEFPWENWWLP